MKIYNHLLCIPSDRLSPSSGHWEPCLLGAWAWISGCWLLWSIPVLVCTWRSFWRIHLILGSRVPRCRSVSVSHYLSKFHWSTYQIHHWTTQCGRRNSLSGHLPQTQRWEDSGSSLQKANPYRQIPGFQFQPPCLGQKSCGKSLNG